jgi:hypothetical protein
MAGRALDELGEYKRDPRAATLATHPVQALHDDLTQLLFVDFYPAVGWDFWWRDLHDCLSAGWREVARGGDVFRHDKTLYCCFC